MGQNQTPLTVQKDLMRHADIKTTMNVYGAATICGRQTAKLSSGFTLSRLPCFPSVTQDGVPIAALNSPCSAP
jgi:hypothetical protein